MKIILITASHQKQANATILARRVLQGLVFEEIDLSNLEIHDVEDHRFDHGWSQHQNDDFYGLMDTMLKSDVVVLASPIYWYSVSARLARFIERWSESRHQNPNFGSHMKSKKMILVLTGGDQPRVKAEPILKQFDYIADFSQIDFYATVIGCANRPNPVLHDGVALKQAQAVNQKLKTMISAPTLTKKAVNYHA